MLKAGPAIAAAKGLEDQMRVHTNLWNTTRYYELIGKQVDGIQEEVDMLASQIDDIAKKAEAEEVQELLYYIRFEPASQKEYLNGVRDKGHEGMRLADFQTHKMATDAVLSEAELVAMRLYTTSAYKFMNNPLRDEERYTKKVACYLPVTTFFATSGIKKMRAVQVATGETILWRGMRDLGVAANFLDEGGTELAFMSTTKNLSVAVQYCLSKNSLLFKIVSTNFMTMGADVSWLSAFPGEEEILYPPLTYLKPTGCQDVVTVKREGLTLTFTVIEVQPQLA